MKKHLTYFDIGSMIVIGGRKSHQRMDVMIKHTDETIQVMIDKLNTLPPHSQEAQILRHDISQLLVGDSAKPKTSELSLIFAELMATL